MSAQKGQQFKMRFFDEADHEEIKQKAKKDDRSVNYIINQAIKEFLSKNKSANA